MNWPPVAPPAPKLLVLPPAAADLGEAEAAIELWEHYSGKVLDPDQRVAVLVMMAQAEGGRWAAATTGREKPRQNGKGDEVEVVELWGLVQRAEAILHTVHDAVMLSTQTQERMLGVVEGSADLRRRIRRVWKGTGQQMIELKNGGTIWYRTRTAKGGLGIDDVDRVVVDEAQEATKEHMAAITPTLLANDNPQLNALGTAGKSGVSAWWWGMRRRALSADPGAFGYVGTTAETVYLDADGRVVQEPVDVEDRALWLAVNPAVRAGRGGGMAFLEEQLRRLGPAGFAREHLGVWDPPDDEDETLWRLFRKAEWEACRSTVPGADWMAGPYTYAVEVTPDRSAASIAAAGLAGDRVGIEVGEHRDGVDWVLPRLVELHAAGWRGLVIDPHSPAKTFIRPLKDLHGIDATPVTSIEYATACEQLHDAVRAGEVAHHGQDELTAAAALAAKRSLASGWVFDRSVGDVTPLSAATLARWGHLEIPEPVIEPGYYPASA